LNLANLLFGAIAIPVGILLGGLVNWLADELPHHLSLSAPKYPDGAPRPRSAWFGLSAYLSGSHLAAGGSRLGRRYPLVELGMAVLFGYIALAYPVGARSLFWMIHVFTLMLITVIDLEHRLILFVVIIPGCLLALLGSALTGRLPFQDYLLGGLLGFGVFFVMYLGGILFSVAIAGARGEPLDEVAFGYGDVMLATLAGFILGWQALIFAMFITVFAGAGGAIVFLVLRLVRKGEYEMFTALPYGQYIVLGTLIMMLWSVPIQALLQGRPL
jgi:leader peptidase (prepilin peptidase)/N-methyltransferase